MLSPSTAQRWKTATRTLPFAAAAAAVRTRNRGGPASATSAHAPDLRNARRSMLVIYRRGGPRHGPPHPPTLGAPRGTRGAPRFRSRSSREAGAGAGSSGQDGLQRQAQHDARGATDEVVPEVADVEREVHHDHQRLRGNRREEDGAAADTPQEERHEEQAEQHAIEDRAQNVDGLDEILRKPGEEREGHREHAPERREASRH